MQTTETGRKQRIADQPLVGCGRSIGESNRRRSNAKSSISSPLEMLVCLLARQSAREWLQAREAESLDELGHNVAVVAADDPH